MKKIKIALLVIFLGLLILALPINRGFVEFFFPTSQQKGVDPMETLTAPFALDPDAPIPTGKLDPSKVTLPVNNVPLEQPHRESREITDWLTNVASEVMMFDHNDYDALIKADEKYFTPAGKQEFLKFLQEKSVMKVLESGDYEVRSFVQDTPLLLNEGAVNGVYRWLYEVPMMVSYMKRGVKDYRKLEPVNQRVLATVQLGRNPDKTSEESVLIERWDGKVERIEN